jgi:murein DD-endopeptidase MepM/ murein hydrolase activator NlpD
VYIHLNNDTPGTDDGANLRQHAFAAGIDKGSKVTAGQTVGFLGDSGNAEEAGAHLHFELHAPDGTVVNPYASLIAAR